MHAQTPDLLPRQVLNPHPFIAVAENFIHFIWQNLRGELAAHALKPEHCRFRLAESSSIEGIDRRDRITEQGTGFTRQ